MLKVLTILLCLFGASFDASARAVKLGSRSNRQQSLSSSAPAASLRSGGISCFENDNCPYDKECVALQCVDVCKNSTCPAGVYCAPAGQDKPHEYRCVECVINFHCPKGKFCDKDHKCKTPDPCEDAVCSPAAPFCMPKPYKTLPYTCVQCTQNDHCPPVAGLTRSCVDGYCLFNVEGNIPKKSAESAEAAPAVESVPAEPPADEVLYDDDLYPYEDEYEDSDY